MLNLNVHFHMIFVAGVYLTDGAAPPVFRHVAVPGTTELQALVQHIAERIGRMLEKRGLIERDCENAWLSSDRVPAGPLDGLAGHFIAYRIAVGPSAGQKVFTLQTVPAQSEGEGRNGAAQTGGFSLHVGPARQGQVEHRGGSDHPATPRPVAMSSAPCASGSPIRRNGAAACAAGRAGTAGTVGTAVMRKASAF